MKLGVVALDGAKVAANAALAANRSYEAIEKEVRRILAERQVEEGTRSAGRRRAVAAPT